MLYLLRIWPLDSKRCAAISTRTSNYMYMNVSKYTVKTWKLWLQIFNWSLPCAQHTSGAHLGQERKQEMALKASSICQHVAIEDRQSATQAPKQLDRALERRESIRQQPGRMLYKPFQALNQDLVPAKPVSVQSHAHIVGKIAETARSPIHTNNVSSRCR